MFKQWTPPVGCRVDWKLTGIRAFGGDLTGIRVKRWGNLTGIRFPLIKARRRRKFFEDFRAFSRGPKGARGCVLFQIKSSFQTAIGV